MKIKDPQLIMVWVLPLIVIGGLFVPILGYLVVAMMIFLLALSFFAGRYWCANLCPRGAFLDIVMHRVSPQKPLPHFMRTKWFRWLVFCLLMGFLVLRSIHSGGNIIVIGAIFVSMCLITTIIAIILGFTMYHRGWCAICPMGLMQEKINKLNRNK